ncbi:hypothetical protein ACFSTD_00225 [Novosphingobium colocasiae]
MADLLKKKEHGDSHRAVKLLMRQTDASERTIKHWLAAQHGPDTVFFSAARCDITCHPRVRPGRYRKPCDGPTILSTNALGCRAANARCGYCQLDAPASRRK